MRATLLEANPTITALLVGAFDLVGIPLLRRTTMSSMEEAMEQARDDDFLILDLTVATGADLARYAPLLEQRTVPVHLMYADESLLWDAIHHVQAHVVVLPATIAWVTLVDNLEDVQRQVYTRRLARMAFPPTEQQRRMLTYIGEGKTESATAKALTLNVSTVRTQLRRLMEKFDISTPKELQALYRLRIL